MAEQNKREGTNRTEGPLGDFSYTISIQSDLAARGNMTWDFVVCPFFFCWLPLKALEDFSEPSATSSAILRRWKIEPTHSRLTWTESSFERNWKLLSSVRLGGMNQKKEKGEEKVTTRRIEATIQEERGSFDTNLHVNVFDIGGATAASAGGGCKETKVA